MNQSKISVRYAKALFSIALEKNILEKIYQDMVLISNSGRIPEMAGLLNSPVISTTEKKKAMASLYEKKVDQITMSFLMLVIENKREIFLTDISRYFIDLHKKEHGIKTVTFITAAEIDETLRKKLIELIKSNFKTGVELNEKIDKDLIGGYILQIDDKQIDTSVSGKLKSLKRDLINTTFEKKL
ncbi:MAG: ATP synthase F1 subunit delta [Bacteroidetes bacterium GWF2_38_335]|nr:MAG: ATP synthase F1 subunit delta [Bacteroidetes bacterium GWF2_38_335]OFY81307.1 MAG: ATP synthase F1 subunit delta [Bacteroidetes bacterium RIFOXYA12_FULL_38_20]HBS85427.1 ATP synthase F1 subunit delta [Bacteroidales bacterium]